MVSFLNVGAAGLASKVLKPNVHKQLLDCNGRNCAGTSKSVWSQATPAPYYTTHTVLEDFRGSGREKSSMQECFSLNSQSFFLEFVLALISPNSF